MSNFQGRLSPAQHVNALAAILIDKYGLKAERVAGHRAARCAQLMEHEWAARWRAVANYIAAKRA
jgi:hypothetical protein